MKYLILISWLFVSCSTTDIAKTQVGATVIANASNKVVDLGLNAGATKIDTGNPYLHSIAVGIRANEGKLVTAADIQKLVIDYGDPNNKSTMKVLAKDLWSIVKSAAIKVGSSTALELAAQGLEKGATSKEVSSP